MHHFCPEIAKEFGVNSAIFLNHVVYWTQLNLANCHNMYDGLCWTYNTIEAFQDVFPYWSRHQLEHLIKNCVRDGLLVEGNYNKVKYDRTKWYALTPKMYQYFFTINKEKYIEAMYSAISENSEIEFVEFRNRFLKNPKPIPDDKPNNKTDNNSVLDKTPEVIHEVSDEKIIDSYHKVLPMMPKCRFVTKDLKAAANKLRRQWPELFGKELTIESLENYFQGIKDIATFLTEPYQTEKGNIRRNNLLTLINIEIIKKFCNGVYSA